MDAAQRQWTHCFFPLRSVTGAALAPRLFAALGTDRERFDDAGQLQEYTGFRGLNGAEYVEDLAQQEGIA